VSGVTNEECDSPAKNRFGLNYEVYRGYEHRDCDVWTHETPAILRDADTALTVNGADAPRHEVFKLEMYEDISCCRLENGCAARSNATNFCLWPTSDNRTRKKLAASRFWKL